MHGQFSQVFSCGFIFLTGIYFLCHGMTVSLTPKKPRSYSRASKRNYKPNFFFSELWCYSLREKPQCQKSCGNPISWWLQTCFISGRFPKDVFASMVSLRLPSDSQFCLAKAQFPLFLYHSPRDRFCIIQKIPDWKILSAQPEWLNWLPLDPQ